ncbi:soluble lytic murein transglycosylase precursor [Beggiatoa sp. PS]|nr:soluble lytic murein transglycosylase precursor [Beggiatoa sp. PS]
MYRKKAIDFVILLVSSLVFSFIPLGFAQAYTISEVETALAHLRVGDFAKATAQLETIMKNDDLQVGDRAALALGNILVQNQKQTEALRPLRRAARSKAAVIQNYARFIFSLAVVEGELTDNYSEASQYVYELHNREQKQISQMLRYKAHFLWVKLHFRQGKWKETIEAGKQFLNVIVSELGNEASCDMALRQETGVILTKSYCKMQEETRWLTAEAYRQLGNYHQAYTLYDSIWYETPAGAWADKARKVLRELEQKVPTLQPKSLSTDEYYQFIQKIWNAGLHNTALTEINAFIKAHPDYSKADYLLYLKIISLHAVRRNDDAVSTMKTLRDRYPTSKRLPAAGIYAIKALRRSDNTPQIQYWVNWIVDNYPNHEKSIEALYNWGGYQCNVVSQEEGIKVLWQVIRKGSQTATPHSVVDDAFWKIIWVQRHLKQTDKAIETLLKLLKTYSESNYYRKNDYRKAEYRKAALYWLGRFTAPNNHRDAIKYFQTVLKEYSNDYYGHRAKEQLIQLGVTIDSKHVGHRKPFPPVDRLTDPNARKNPSEAYLRAITLKSLGLYELAAEELESLSELQKDSGIQFALADLYARAGNTWSAIIMINRYFREFVVAGSPDPALVPRDFWYIVYPFNYRQEINTAIKESQHHYATNLEPYIIAALIRTESLFYPRAISPVGAIGLMQLMPATASRMVKQLKTDELSDINRSKLFEPAMNIRLGTLHFAERVNDFKGDWYPAICSYNAGASPVKRWWEKKPKNQPLDEFFENIPYPETRNYIKRVISARDNYQWIYPDTNLRSKMTSN